ncbi:MAG: SDR family oxidoreductase [Chitinophagaceae bacterium]
MELQNKAAVITGGTHGIGAATALKLAKEGTHLALVARNAGDEQLKKDIEASGVHCFIVQADLAKEEDCIQAVQKVHDHFGRIDILVHSAGSAAPGSLLNVEKETWYKAFDIHVHAVFHLCRAIVPYMKEQKQGAIILISSAAGVRGVKNAISYAVVKGALPQFTRAMAFELSDFNISVNCVSPGVIRTRFQDYLTPEQVANNINNRIPLHKEGSPDDVASVIQSLLQNNFITGENVVIDGGMTMRIV